MVIGDLMSYGPNLSPGKSPGDDGPRQRQRAEASCHCSRTSCSYFAGHVVGHCSNTPLADSSLTLLVLAFLCGLQEEEPQTAHLVSITWASPIAASVLTDVKLLPNQSIILVLAN